MNEFREQFLKEKEKQAKQLFESIKENPRPDVLDLWKLPEKYFIEWRKVHDFPILLKKFDEKLLLFKEWKQDNNLTDELILSTGYLTSFLEHKKLSKKKRLYYIKQTINTEVSYFVSYERRSDEGNYDGSEYKHETLLEFYSYKDWLKRRNKDQNVFSVTLRQAPETNNERVFIHNDYTKGSNNGFELLKMGGIEAPVNDFGILYRGKRLEFVNLCGLKLNGDIVFGEEGNLSCSYCACDNMVADNLKIANLSFEHCTMSNLTIQNSAVQQWKIYDCEVTGEFSNSQLRMINIWGGSFKPVLKNCTISEFEIEKERNFSDKNLYAYKLLKKVYADQGDDLNAIKYFIKEHNYIRNNSRFRKRLGKTISWLYWGYGRKPARIIWTSLLIIIAFAVLIWFNRENIVLNNGKPVYLSFLDCLYFSTTTFTTLGYGDYSPIGWMRIASILVSFGGVLNVGFLVAGYASNKY